jgi:hypothetical protein
MTMFKWHVWGDFAHTRPEQIGAATAISEDDRAARKTAEDHGFDFDRRMRNGFEPWATTFVAENDENQEFEFASYPIVRGWQRL